MTYLTPRQSAKAFRSKGYKVYGSYATAVRKAKTIRGRTAVLGISGGKYIIKRV